MRRIVLRSIVAVAGIFLMSASVAAKVRLQSFVTDSMVVQQLSVWTIVGHTDGKSVAITPSWDGKSVTATVATDGSFSAQISTPKAGGPFTVTFDDGETTVLHDIYVGEVWLCSGQSNMEMPVGGWGKVMNYEQEIANAHHPEVRFLQIKRLFAPAPKSDAEVTMGGWRTCTPSTVENFSSLAYFYAREMAKQLGVHVGVIDCSWGGTPAEAWTSFEGVSSVKGFEKEIKTLEINGFDKDRIKAYYDKETEDLVLNAIGAKGESEGGSNLIVLSDDCATGKMPFPEAWENTVLPDLDGVVVVQKDIDIPDSWAGKPLTLHLGAIDDEDKTYFNGVKIGTGFGWNVTRTYTVPADMVKAGKSVITIIITDYGDGGGIYCDAKDLAVEQNGETISLAGDWSYKVVMDYNKMAQRPVSPESQNYPTSLYNAMLSPLHTLPIKGVLWYQGCANVGRADQYTPLFQRMIKDWRKLWNNEQLPFYFVQLAGYLKPQTIQPESQWAALRQAQANALTLPNTAMAVAIDIGNPNDIHPKNKQEVARRLSLIALKNQYGHKEIVDKAPTLKAHSIKANKAVLTFDNAIVVDGTTPQGFIVKTDDGTWAQPTKLQVSGKKVKIEANGNIKAIKYNWADYPDGNLRGKTKLPIPQFVVED